MAGTPARRARCQWPTGRSACPRTDEPRREQLGELVREAGSTPIKAGDVVVLKVDEAHDLVNTASEDLRVIGFFSAPQVEQHWTDDSWGDDGKVTGSPNR